MTNKERTYRNRVQDALDARKSGECNDLTDPVDILIADGMRRGMRPEGVANRLERMMQFAYDIINGNV